MGFCQLVIEIFVKLIILRICLKPENIKSLVEIILLRIIKLLNIVSFYVIHIWLSISKKYFFNKFVN